MQHDVARKLAESARLSDALQHRLWVSSDPWVRRTLAGRPDLADDLQRQAVADDELIQYWARRQRGNRELLDTAVANASSEMSLMALCSQEALRPSHVVTLAAKATAAVGWVLLEHHDVPVRQARYLVKSYVASLAVTESAGRVFSDRVRNAPELLAAATEAVTWKQVGVLRVAVGEIRSFPELLGPIVDAMMRLAGDAHHYHPDAVPLRTVVRSVEDLLRSPHITSAQLAMLASLEILGEFSSELEARIRADVAGGLARLDCVDDRGCDIRTAKRHARILNRISRHENLYLPDAVILEALRHRAYLSTTVYTTIVTDARGMQARSVAAELARTGRISDLTELARQAGTLLLDDLDEAGEVLRLLAVEGHRDLTTRRVPAAHRGIVVQAFRPIRALLSEPEMLADVLSNLESLDPVVAEIALGLLGEWEGDLPSLVAAARHLAD
jgi:hypothetical protein